MGSEISVVENVNENVVKQDVFDTMRNLHEKVSLEDTPKTYVKKKMGMDYVEIGYMKSVANKYYPGWSWTIVRTEMLGSEAFMVHGRLKWFEGGIWREGDMTAAHRIQKLRDKDGFVDVGNDIKSANTDAMKKAFNMYMNIADDVYRNRIEDTSLSKDDIDYINTEMEGLSDEWKEKISLYIENGDIEKKDIAKVINKINQVKESENE
tara:strand:- start:37320 stop:37943 length:624 start_codon:yes stop_codon:yes gene_type:complete